MDDDSGSLRGISLISEALNTWKQALLNGHLPEFGYIKREYEAGNLNEDSDSSIWPDKVLSEEIFKTFNKLELPFLTNRHPELIPAVLRGLLEMCINYSKRIVERNTAVQDEEESEKLTEKDENDPSYWEDNMYNENILLDKEEEFSMPDGTITHDLNSINLISVSLSSRILY